jgi:hypothetical protein
VTVRDDSRLRIRRLALLFEIDPQKRSDQEVHPTLAGELSIAIGLADRFPNLLLRVAAVLHAPRVEDNLVAETATIESLLARWAGL